MTKETSGNLNALTNEPKKAICFHHEREVQSPCQSYSGWLADYSSGFKEIIGK